MIYDIDPDILNSTTTRLLFSVTKYLLKAKFVTGINNMLNIITSFRLTATRMCVCVFFLKIVDLDRYDNVDERIHELLKQEKIELKFEHKNYAAT